MSFENSKWRVSWFQKSAAQPKYDTLVTGSSPAILTGSALEPQVFTAGGVGVNCTEVSLGKEGTANTITSKTTEATVHPEYKTCSIPELGSAEVVTKGCHYLFTGETNASNLAQVHIICSGAGIEIKGPLGCTITVPSQTVTGVNYANGSGDVVLTPNVTGIHFTATAICAFVGIPSSGTNATYTGKVTVKADKDENGVPGAATTLQYETMATTSMP